MFRVKKGNVVEMDSHYIRLLIGPNTRQNIIQPIKEITNGNDILKNMDNLLTQLELYPSYGTRMLKSYLKKEPK